MIYRDLPTSDAVQQASLHGYRPKSSWRQRLKCAIGMHERVLDYVNQTPFCTACGRHLWRDYSDLDGLHLGRVHFEVWYGFIPARLRGKMDGDGQLRWLGWGVPGSKKVAERWAREARSEHLRADIASLRLMLMELPDGWSPEREEFTARIETLRAELAEKKDGKQ